MPLFTDKFLNPLTEDGNEEETDSEGEDSEDEEKKNGWSGARKKEPA